MVGTTTERSARDLAAAWDIQQSAYIRYRNMRFAVIARVIKSVCAESASPLVLDLAAGTGALGRAILASVPNARVVLVDKDPVLLKIAREIHSDDDRVTVVSADLDSPDWREEDPALSVEFDAVASTTALHWLTLSSLVELYCRLARMVRPGGIMLNGDHLRYDSKWEPTMSTIAAADEEQQQIAVLGTGASSWNEWWDVVASIPRFSDALQERQAVWRSRGASEIRLAPLAFHLQAMRAAGFTEVGSAWQYLDNYVIYGVR